METKQRQKLLIIGAVTCMALLLGDWVIAGPLIASWKNRQEKIGSLRKQVDQGKMMVDREQTIRSLWESMRTNTLPANTSLAEQEFIKIFYRCARDSGISIVSFRPQWKQNGDDYTTYECAADASGNLETLSRFIYELEKRSAGPETGKHGHHHARRPGTATDTRNSNQRIAAHTETATMKRIFPHFLILTLALATGRAGAADSTNSGRPPNLRRSRRIRRWTFNRSASSRSGIFST